MRSLATIVLALVALTCVCAFPQSNRAIGVRGTLVCGNKPLENVRVRLFRVEQKKADDLAQILDEKITSNSGMFHLEGNTNGFPTNESDIKAVVSFYHHCDDDAKTTEKGGYRKFNYHIPESYVSGGAKAKKTYDLGTLNVQLEFPAEKRDKKFVERTP